MIFLYLHLLFANSFKFDSMLLAHDPKIHMSIATDVENFSFHKITLPVTKVGFSVGVSLSGENLFEM